MINDVDTVPLPIRRVLIHAGSFLCDRVNEVLFDRAGVTPTTVADELGDVLPPCFAEHYDGRFLVHFRLCLELVAWKLESSYKTSTILACRVEELALRAMVVYADFVLENTELYPEAHTVTREDIDQAFDDLLDDFDVDLLLTAGAKATEVLDLLAFEDWFVPFDEDHPIHPFITLEQMGPKLSLEGDPDCPF